MSDSESSSTSTTRYSGYANYERVSDRVGAIIDEAVSSYAYVDSIHAEGGSISPNEAAEARSAIKTAAMCLTPEMEQDEDSVEIYKEILEDWHGEDGYIARFESDDFSLRHESPNWLHNFVLDIRRAGWHIGYLAAGRSEKTEEGDPEEVEPRAMFTESG